MFGNYSGGYSGYGYSSGYSSGLGYGLSPYSGVSAVTTSSSPYYSPFKSSYLNLYGGYSPYASYGALPTATSFSGYGAYRPYAADYAGSLKATTFSSSYVPSSYATSTSPYSAPISSYVPPVTSFSPVTATTQYAPYSNISAYGSYGSAVTLGARNYGSYTPYSPYGRNYVTGALPYSAYGGLEQPLELPVLALPAPPAAAVSNVTAMPAISTIPAAPQVYSPQQYVPQQFHLVQQMQQMQVGAPTGQGMLQNASVVDVAAPADAPQPEGPAESEMVTVEAQAFRAPERSPWAAQEGEEEFDLEYSRQVASRNVIGEE